MTEQPTHLAESPARAIPDVASLRSDLRARRQSIIDAAQTLMIEVDLDTIQVRDLVSASGVALGTVYRYFSSKDHVLACALSSWAVGFGDRLELAADDDLRIRIKTIYRAAARAFERQPRVYGVMLEVQNSKDEHAAAAFTEFAEQQTERFDDALGTADLAVADRRAVVEVMAAVLNENLRRWHRGEQEIDAVYDAIDRAADLICGPGPEPAHPHDR